MALTGHLGRFRINQPPCSPGNLQNDLAIASLQYHSFAFAGPFFESPLAWRTGERRDDGRFAQLDVTVERLDGT